MVKPPDGLIIPVGSVLLFRGNGSTFKIEPRKVYNIYRDGSVALVYDLGSVDETMRVITDYGTYFSVEDAIQKCQTLSTPRNKTGILPC